MDSTWQSINFIMLSRKVFWCFKFTNVRQPVQILIDACEVQLIFFLGFIVKRKIVVPKHSWNPIFEIDRKKPLYPVPYGSLTVQIILFEIIGSMRIDEDRYYAKSQSLCSTVWWHIFDWGRGVGAGVGGVLGVYVFGWFYDSGKNMHRFPSKFDPPTVIKVWMWEKYGFF